MKDRDAIYSIFCEREFSTPTPSYYGHLLFADILKISPEVGVGFFHHFSLFNGKGYFQAEGGKGHGHTMVSVGSYGDIAGYLARNPYPYFPLGDVYLPTKFRNLVSESF